MKKIFWFIIVILITFCSCNVYVNNTIPMYGGVKKSSSYKKLDDEFIQSSIKDFGNRDSASKSYVRLAWQYLMRNDIETSIKRFNQAWLLDNKNSGVYYGFSAFSKIIGKTDDEKKYYEMGKQYDQNNKSLMFYLNSLSDFYNIRQDFENVIDCELKILEINPDNASSYSLIGYSYMILERFPESLQYINQAIKINANDTISLLNKGWVFYLQKKYSESMEEFTNAINKSKAYISAYANRGLAKHELKDYTGAISDNNTCLQLVDQKDTPYFNYSIGLSLLKLDKKNEACLKFQEALRIIQKYSISMPQVNEAIKKNCE